MNWPHVDVPLRFWRANIALALVALACGKPLPRESPSPLKPQLVGCYALDSDTALSRAAPSKLNLTNLPVEHGWLVTLPTLDKRFIEKGWMWRTPNDTIKVFGRDIGGPLTLLLVADSSASTLTGVAIRQLVEGQVAAQIKGRRADCS